MRQFLFIDHGNTAIKGLLTDEFFRPVRSFTEKPEAFLQGWKTRVPEPGQITGLYASVGNLTPELQHLLETDLRLAAFSANMPIPLKMGYHTPETLGPDRLAVAIGGYTLYPAQNVLVLDFGTCLKCDFVSGGGRYEGGSISPGLQMRFGAMHTFTAKLPLLHRPENFPPHPIGRSTAESMQNGVLLGMLAEAEGMVRRYRELYPDVRVLVTGGDAEVFEGHLKNAIFVRQNLALLGLAETMKHHANTPNI